MPRVHYVKKCRHTPGKCGKCDAAIRKGESYKWWQFAYRGKSLRCAKPACAPKQSDLTQSEFWGTMFGIMEGKPFDGAATIDDLESAKTDVVGQLEELRDEQENKKSNMPDALQDSASGELLQERYDALDSAISDLESVDISFDEEEPDESKEAEHEKWEEALKEKVDEIAQELSDALDNISCS